MNRYRPEWRQAAPYEPDPWYVTVGVILIDLLVLLTLMLGIPFLLWLVAA